MGSVVKKLGKRIVHKISQSFLTEPGCGQFQDLKGKCLAGNPAGISASAFFFKKLGDDPLLAGKLAGSAWGSYRASEALKAKLAAIHAEEKIPMEEVIRTVFGQFCVAYSGNLEPLLDYEAYKGAMLGNLNLAGGYPQAMAEADIAMSMQPPSARNCELGNLRANYLHLAHRFGSHSDDPAAYAYADFDWQWYCRNQLPLVENFRAMKLTEADVEKNMARFIESEGLSEGGTSANFEAVRSRLRDLHDTERDRQLLRQAAVERLRRNAAGRAEECVAAMAYFAGQASELNEALHADIGIAINHLRIAGEKRGIGQRKVIGLTMKFILKSTAKLLFGQPRIAGHWQPQKTHGA